MDPEDVKWLNSIADSLKSVAGTLKYQVLNNLDGCVGEGVETKTLDGFIKRPIMQSVVKLETLRATLLSRTSKGRLPNHTDQKGQGGNG